jgi:hypothetical protein
MQFWRRNAVTLGLMSAAALAIAALRAPLGKHFESVKTANDVYALPSPNQVVVMSLGYRSALADLIFANTLVASGLHFQERRPFEFAGRYIETVNALDPKFAAPYRMADGLLTLQAKAVSKDVYWQTRRILERGMAELPFDQRLWASAGQFFAYLGPSIFEDPKEQEEWRLAGGRAMARACELVGTSDRVPDQCLAAAGFLSQSGAATANRELIERMLNASDDPRVRTVLSTYLAKAAGNELRDRSVARRELFQAAWAADLPFASRGATLVIGPRWDAAACAGTNDCATSWRAWGELQQGVPGTTTGL